MPDYIPKNPKSVLKPGELYLGDNGRCFCMQHAGASALYTGRDLDGRRVHRITEADRAYWRKEIGRDPQCEECAADERTKA